MNDLRAFLNKNKNQKVIHLFFDIETLQFNELAGAKKPTHYKNVVYSFAVSWLENGQVGYEIFPNLKAFMIPFEEIFKDRKTKPNISLNAHNTNKYDNHFLRKDLLYYYPHMRVENFYMRTAIDSANENALKINQLTKEDKEGIILEKRIKSNINLELTFFLYGQRFSTVDNYMKTDSSIQTLGYKLLSLGVVSEDDLKTDFNYTQYNIPHDMTPDDSRAYALEVFQQLDDDELHYIRNDVYLLAKAVYHYSDMFQGFDYRKMTFTSNILETYNTNELTQFQLLNQVGDYKDRIKINYTDYKFSNQNFYDYLKNFYSGGLNFYNQHLVGRTITGGVFGMDIHSSYPYAMHNFKIPTFVKDYHEYQKRVLVPVDYSDETYTIYQVDRNTFDEEILRFIPSILIKQMLTKYFSSFDDFVYINSYTFKLVQAVTGTKITEINAYSTVTFDCEYFGSRDQIGEFYYIKTQGKEEMKVEYKDPYNIKRTDIPNDRVFTPEEYNNSKVNLNGLYGIPALRPYFNLFRKTEDGYKNFENGHVNNERNIVFSIFVTSVALWNLLRPLGYLTQDEIDENFIYADTDSLYIKSAVKHKIPDSLFTDFALGTWDLEHEHLEKFHVLNHKKYCYQENEDSKIIVKSGGIPNNAYNTNMPFDEFIETQFSHGVEIKNQKGIYNEDETISIYPSITKLELGKGYPIYMDSPLFKKHAKRLIEEIKKEFKGDYEDFLYIESNFGTYSLAELFPYSHEVEKKKPLAFLEIKQKQIKERLNK